ncbi:glycosyl hydrolase family 28-related protein [Yersinia kristensenii]|uniref:tail fiber/spike domain-containing protein n=1 Tax=Yersinia kristensenii TaxID=28152 RepID=UPI0005E30CD0|nr:glycosyl hydrolase family 28-related protein [Yersinia kristensenii]CNG29722.1 Pectate lyase superfamily protein [Yersinia kristensenii]CNJ67378.1 Pectate lyase superfamily protein [Yersinia kristensenii]
MATIPTQNPVPSEAAIDLKFNAGKIDEFVTSFLLKYTDRLGRDHLTIEGIRDIVEKAIKEFGWVTIDSFEIGATLTNSSEVLRWESNGEYYRWDGEFPKVVPVGSTPDTTGGIGTGKWLSIGDAVLRSDLKSKIGYSEIGEFASINDLRSYSALSAGFIGGERVSVKSYYSGLSYGGGFFRWNSASTAADDGGYTINPTGNAGAGRWKREIVAAYSARTVSPLEFGAKLNDSTFDSSVAINAAISYLNPYINKDYDQWTGGDVVLPAGKYYINDTIYGAPNVRFIGTGGIPGFRQTMNGATSIYTMPTMTTTKVMYDTAPWLTDNSDRYKKTGEMIFGTDISQGYYGAYIENVAFIGSPDTQAGVRIWRVPRSQLNNVSVFNCKVGFWLNSSWELTVRNCYSLGQTYAVFLLYGATAINFYAGYFTSARKPWAEATAQWFHRAASDSNKSNIAFTTTFLYASNVDDLSFHGVTIENNNRDFALFYTRNVNVFGGYIEDVTSSATEIGHRVLVQCVSSRINFNGTFISCSEKPAVVQSGNTGDINEISQVNFIRPRMNQAFVSLYKDLGFGSYNIRVESEHPTTINDAETLSAQRLYIAQCVGLLDNYTMRSPQVTKGTTTFDISTSNCTTGGEYSCRLLMKNVSLTLQQDIRFNVLVGPTSTVTGYQGRSTVGTSPIPAPTAVFNSTTGVLTLTFSGNYDLYSLNRIKVVPTDNQPLFRYSTS